MNAFIENLNQFGGQFLNFAWLMLWQSSLLIAFVFTLDILLARKIRASVRYAVWLVVVVKLLLPPTLALPTGATWWLFQTKAVVKVPVVRNYSVTYDTAPPADFIPQTIPLPAPLPPKLDAAGWTLFAVCAISVGLLLWLAIRWWQVARIVRFATASAKFTDTLEAARQMAKLRFKPQLKLIEGRMSPAVCGLFRPVILLPCALAEKLSPAQLRAVLLHELFHLRRLDVWVNCAQALLQIVYWWHPLLWIANARIRRVREEAVDDAVMLALRDEADSYAPTLLEVAKLAFRRPLLSLGLVGIMESRSALRQRIERLVNFRAPRKAGLTFASLCGIFVFSAVALPMGEAPGSPDKNNLPAAPPSITSLVSTPTNTPQVLIQAEIYRIRQADFEKLVSDPAFVSTRKDDVNNFQQFERLVKLSGFQPISRPRILTRNGLSAEFYVGDEATSIELECLPLVTNGLIHLANHIKIILTAEGVVTTNKTNTQTTLQNGGGQVFSIKSPDGQSESNIVVMAIGVQIITNKSQFQQRLEAVVQHHQQATDDKTEVGLLVQDGKLLYEMGKLNDAEAKLKNALAANPNNPAAQYYLNLVEQARSAPKSGGVKFVHPVLRGSIASRPGIIERLHKIHLEIFGYDAAPLNVVQEDLGQAIGEKDADKLGIRFMQSPDLNSVLVTIEPPLTNVLAQDALDAIVAGANKPIKYSIFEQGVEFSWKNQSTPTLYSRNFRVDTNAFTAALRRATGSQNDDIVTMARNYFSKLGVDLNPTTPGGFGKNIFVNDRLGELFVRATQRDLDKIEDAIVKLNFDSAPQVHIKARFVEVPKGTVLDFGNFLSGTNSADEFTGILTSTNARSVLRSLESHKGFETLAEPEVVTTSGRQAQVRAIQTISILTNFVFEEFPTNHDGSVGTSSITAKTGPIETGPIFDVVPYVLSDGYTLDLQMTASSMEFYGYADIPTNMPPLTVTTSTGETVNPPRVWPAVLLYRKSAHVNLFDSQTVILSLTNPEQVRFGEPDEKREAVVAKHIRDAAWHNGGRNDILVFITATIVDPAGNRVHSDDELPSAKDKIPPQPPQ